MNWLQFFLKSDASYARMVFAGSISATNGPLEEMVVAAA